MPWGLPSTGQLFDRVVSIRSGRPDMQQGMFAPLSRMLRRVRSLQGDRFDFEDLTTWIVEEGLKDEHGDYDIDWWTKLGLPEAEKPDHDPEFFHRMLLWSFALVLIMGDEWSNAFGGNRSWMPPKRI
jgi:hypothetical protein